MCFCVLSFSITVLQSMKLGIDVNRHKEIIVKAISALLLLLLKHFKLNHIYQVIDTAYTLYIAFTFSFLCSILLLSAYIHILYTQAVHLPPCYLHLITPSGMPLLSSIYSPLHPHLCTSIHLELCLLPLLHQSQSLVRVGKRKISF